VLHKKDSGPWYICGYGGEGENPFCVESNISNYFTDSAVLALKRKFVPVPKHHAMKAYRCSGSEAACGMWLSSYSNCSAPSTINYLMGMLGFVCGHEEKNCACTQYCLTD
jgi:hypothetical protein